MAEDMARDSDEQRAKHRVTEVGRQPERQQGEQANQGENQQYSSALLGDSRLGERGNSSVRTSVMRSAQSTHGNRAVQRFLQGAGAGLAEAEQEDGLARRIESQAGIGGKLPANVQAKLEDGMGADLSGVRIHTGGEADHLARSMNAIAFTTGSDIFFQEGKYDPSSDEGLKLLAHETTHTIQQADGPVEGTPSAGGVSISNPSDTFEQEAEKTAEAVVSGRQSDIAGDKSAKSTAAGTSVQRFTEPTPWMNASPFVEPTPWAGHGGRHSDWNGMPSGPNIGIEPANPGAGWAQAPHTPAPQIDNPAFPGGGPFFNPTPSFGGGGGGGGSAGGGGYDPAFGGSGGPFFNPTPDIPLPFHPMPGGGSGFGWQPSGLDEKPGPWAYYKGNGKQGLDMGVEGGFGLFHGEATMGGIPVTDDILYAQGKLGAWDNGQGGMRHGASGTVGVGKASFNNGGMVSGDMEALTASAEASWGDDGATLGAQATAVGGSVTLGGDPSAKSDHDESVRLGLSEGIGMAGRLHWGDKDKDGHSEYGFGADFGPFSFDIKSEDPIRTLANTAAGPMMANMFLGEGNATAPVERAAKDTWNATKAGANEIWNDTKAGASEMWDDTKKFAGQAGEYATNAYDGMAGAASSAYDAVSDYLPW